MRANQQNKGTLIIAGPGAGKTHNMVEKIITDLPYLSTARYMAVITYTNAATENIRSRLSKRIAIPENLFIGTIHSFLNRFVVIPYGNFGAESVGIEKLFMQCGLDDVVAKVLELDPKKKTTDYVGAAALKAQVRKKLNKKGYITFDQTILIARDCVENKAVCDVLCNRLQYLFVDEFQDSGNHIYSIIERIRKVGKTKLYCVGDPEQYIQSYDSSIKQFSNIPILKAAASTGYTVEINSLNFRCAPEITTFLNRFNARLYKSNTGHLIFSQQVRVLKEGDAAGAICYVQGAGIIKEIVEIFYKMCEQYDIPIDSRCLIAKETKTVDRIIAAINNHYQTPLRGNEFSTLKAVQDALLSVVQMTQAKYFETNQTDIYGLRRSALKIITAINTNQISNENTFVQFVQQELKLTPVTGLPVKVENLKMSLSDTGLSGVPVVSTIHGVKGLEYAAVLTIAKNEEELNLWIETRISERDKTRNKRTTDHPRLGYVAFSRAKRMLCIACMTAISASTRKKLIDMDITTLN